jgi:P27 family predicted phage terminase small subunit
VKGRKPTPTPLKLLRGEGRAGRLNHNEPAAPLGAPPRPEWLNLEAARVWDELVPQLVALGYLAKIEWSPLANLCLAIADVRRYEERLQELRQDEDGEIVVTEKGYAMPHPYLALRRQAMEMVNKCSSELGLSPTSRTRVVALAQPEAAKDKFFG